MKNVKPFVDLGFYVVPFTGVIKRTADGKKIVPPAKGPWKELYVEERYDPEKYKEPYAVTGAFIVGSKSGAVSIDCDNAITYNMFKVLDPDYDFEFKSKGKTKEKSGSSIIYSLSKDIEDIPFFQIQGIGGINLEYRTGNDKLQFLPTSGNKSKVEWKAEDLDDMPVLKDPPEAVVNYLRALYELQKVSKEQTANSLGILTQSAIDKHYKSLAPFCEEFLAKDKFAPELFRILCPKDGGFRELPQYVKEKTLHPNNVPEGLGNNYMIRVAAVLVCDDSVSPELFKSMIYKINSMWDKPYSATQIKELVRFQLTRPEWVYDKNWVDKVSMVITEYGTMITTFYDPIARNYYALDNHFGMSVFSSVDLLAKHLSSVTLGGRTYKSRDVYSYLETKKTIMSALESFGDLPPENRMTNLNRYNLFSRSKQYDVLLNPHKYDDEFKGKKPTITLEFWKHLIPDMETREYVQRFILTKLTTLEFSEVILYFLGKQGAGKNLLVDYLSEFCSNAETSIKSADYQLVVEVDLENFLSKYNLWIVNALFANLDEYGDKTTSNTQDRQVLANLKSFTGKSQIQLRTMGTDPVPAFHKCTFLITANTNRLSLDLDDRRMVVIDCPTALKDSDFVMLYGGKSKVIKQLFEEQCLWAYYWATEFENLSRDEYRTPPDTEFKHALIMRHLPPSSRIASVVKNQDMNTLIGMCDEHGFMLEKLVECGKAGMVSINILEELFENLTEGTNARKSMLSKACRDMNLVKGRFRVGKKQYYGYNFPALKAWANKHTVKDGLLLINDL